MSSGSPAPSPWTGLAVRPKTCLLAGASSAPHRALPPPPCPTVSSADPMERRRWSAFHPQPYPPLDPDPYMVGGGSQEDCDPWSPPDIFSLCGCGNVPLHTPHGHTHSDTHAQDTHTPVTHAPGERLYYTNRRAQKHRDGVCVKSRGVCYPLSDSSSHRSPRLPAHLHRLTSCLPTVASEPAFRRDTHTSSSSSSSSSVPLQRSHLPHFPHPHPHHTHPEPSLSNSTSIRDPGHGAVLTQPPSPSLGLPPPPPPPALQGLGAAGAGWGCCCPLGGDPTPLSRYLGKVGETAQPLLNVGGLLNPKLSDVQT